MPASAGAAAAGILTESNTDSEDFLLEAIVKITEVHINTNAKIAVNLLTALKAVGLANKLSAPDAPKIPAAEPLPLCNSTNKMSKTQTMKCNVKIKVYILGNSPVKITISLYKFLRLMSFYPYGIGSPLKSGLFLNSKLL